MSLHNIKYPSSQLRMLVPDIECSLHRRSIDIEQYANVFHWLKFAIFSTPYDIAGVIKGRWVELVIVSITYHIVGNIHKNAKKSDFTVHHKGHNYEKPVSGLPRLVSTDIGNALESDDLGSFTARSISINEVITVNRLLMYSCLALQIQSNVPKHEHWN